MYKKFFRNFCNKIQPYQIPTRYEEAFYLANASLFDSINYFIHSTLVKFYPDLLKLYSKGKNCALYESDEKNRQFINILEQCNKIIDVRFDIKRANGKFEVIRGFCAMHGRCSGFYPSLGGQ